MSRKGYRHLYQVAEYFEVTSQTLSGWIKHQKIPPKHLLKYYQDIPTNPAIPPEFNTVDLSADTKITSINSEKVSIAKFFLLISKHIRLFLLIPLLMVIPTLIYLFFIAKPVYKTTAVILPTEKSSQSISGLLGAAAQAGLNIPFSMEDNISWDELYPEIVKSQRLKRILLRDTFSTNKYGIGETLQSILSRELRISGRPLREQQEEGVKALTKMINVKKARFSAIVNLEVFGFEAEFTAELARRIIKLSGRLQREYKTKQVVQKRQFLEDRIQGVEKELRIAEQALETFREQNRRPEKSPSLILKEERLNQTLVLQRSLMITLSTQFEKAKIEEVEKSVMIQVIDEPNIPWKRVSPKIKIWLLVVLTLSLMLSLFVIYTKEFLLIPSAKNRK